MDDRASEPAVSAPPDSPTSRTSRREALGQIGMLGLGAIGALTPFSAPDEASASTRQQSKPFRILAFCGGGIRGIASAAMLQRLARRSPKIVSEADMLAGTSVGASVISLLLANLSPREVYRYLTTGPPQFFKNPNTDPKRPAFDIEGLLAAQRQLHPDNPSLNQLKKKVLLTSFNVGDSHHDWHAVLFNNFRKSTTGHASLIEAVLSSGAMPGELGSYKGHIDGAFVNHDPTLAAIALAVDDGVKLEDIVVICFGTGFMGDWIASDTSHWGADQWQHGNGDQRNRTPSTLINGSDSPVLSAALDGPSTNLAPELSRMMLGGRYAYLNPTLARYIPEDDTDPADLAYLEAQANKVDISAAAALSKRYWR
ncbi:MAG TPA: patatin-like phospholipase family protein [Solirubrobacteraceae bacterium]|jgi:hypothetical protein|nr:patatin-like phospholipase family protein [Solirubrobacteraceae bacterium]